MTCTSIPVGIVSRSQVIFDVDECWYQDECWYSSIKLIMEKQQNVPVVVHTTNNGELRRDQFFII